MTLPYMYTPDVPKGYQQINNTQQPINNNFQDIPTLFGINHIGFNTLDDFGKHNFITYCKQNKIPETSSADMVLFSQEIDGVTQLNYRYPNNGATYSVTQPYYYPTAGTNRFWMPKGNPYTDTSAQFYLNGGILCSLTIITTPNQSTRPYSGEFTYTYNWGQLAAYKQTPFYLSIQTANLSTGSNNNDPLKSGLVSCKAINSNEFSITIENGGGNRFLVMALGI